MVNLSSGWSWALEIKMNLKFGGYISLHPMHIMAIKLVKFILIFDNVSADGYIAGKNIWNIA